MPRLPVPRRCRPRAAGPRAGLRLAGLELLETRLAMSAVPFGATESDTSEFFLGSVLVNVVLFESTGAIDPSTENWTPELIQEAKDKVEDSMDWWSRVLNKLGSVHHLDFEYNYQWADAPVPTGFEPITRTANTFTEYVDDFLQAAGHTPTGDFIRDVQSFNHAQRVAHDTNWSFTVFVINSTADSDDRFDLSGSYNGAFAYYAAMTVVPSGRPVSSFAHETGHIFWAFDEYSGGDSYSLKRGYYGTQNTNSPNGAPSGFVQQASLMSSGSSLASSFASETLPASTRAVIGWKDSDGDGVFDVYDVPQVLTGVGHYDAASRIYRFRGNAAVDPLVNRNTDGTQNNIALARIGRLEYRINSTTWQPAALYDDYQVQIDAEIEMPASWATIELRTIDPATGIASNTFLGTPSAASATATPGINGLAWSDADSDGVWDAGESPLADWTVRLVNAAGQPITLATRLDPDEFSEGQLLNQIVSGVRLTALGSTSTWVTALSSSPSATAPRVFGAPVSGGTSPLWTSQRRLKIEFDTPQKQVSLIAVGGSAAVGGAVNIGRLEAYDALGNLLDSYNSAGLAAGQTEQMTVARDQGDIAYVIARSPNSDGVVLDRLLVGPNAATTTDAQGRYTLPYLPAGSFRVAMSPMPGWAATQAIARNVTLTAGGTATNANFSFQFAANYAPYYNPLSPYDVSGDGQADVADLLILVGYTRTHGFGALAPPSGAVTQFVDVNGDNWLTAADLAALSGYVRSLAGGSGSGEGGGSGGSGGEATFDVPLLRAPVESHSESDREEIERDQPPLALREAADLFYCYLGDDHHEQDEDDLFAAAGQGF